MKIKITTPALFKFVKLLKKMGIDFEELMKKAATTDISKVTAEDFGIKMFTLIYKGIEKIEDDTYEFLSLIFKIDIEELKEIDFLVEILPAFRKYEGWKSFLSNVQNLEETLKK